MTDLLDHLVATFGDDLVARATEDASSFGYRTATGDPAELGKWLKGLVDHRPLCRTSVECTIARGLDLSLDVVTPTKLLPREVKLDSARYQEPRDAVLRKTVDGFRKQLKKPRERVERWQLISQLTEFAEGGLELELELRLSVDKQAWRRQLVGEPAARVVLFAFAARFAGELKRKTLKEIADDWFPGDGRPTIFLVLDARGWLGGKATACLGSDRLDRADDFTVAPDVLEHLRACWDLCDDQAGWKAQPEVLAPDHFDLEDHGFRGRAGDAPAAAAGDEEAVEEAAGAGSAAEPGGGPAVEASGDRPAVEASGGEPAEHAGSAEVVRELRIRAAQLAICYLAERTDGKTDPRHSRFLGHPVAVDQAALRRSIPERGSVADPLLALYRWSYGNRSQAQLHVARRAIRLKLGEDEGKNLERLLARAGEIQQTADSSLQQAFKEKVDKLFNARREACEYLRAYTRDVAALVTGLTDELVGNLYKTLAALIAALVAAGVSEQPEIAFLTAGGLYAVYILFILFYLLPAIWRKSELHEEEYESNVENLAASYSLTEEERQKFDLPALAASKDFFRRYFWATVTIYALLAVVAVAAMLAFGG